MLFRISIATIALVTLIASCVSKKNAVPQKPVETSQLKGISVAKNAKAVAFRAATPILFQIEHTDINVTPQWNDHTIKGTVKHSILLSSLLANNTISLDAKSMKTSQVLCNGAACKFSTSAKKLDIEIPVAYNKVGNRIELVIEYVASPDAKEKGGSASIRDDKGFYFINTDGVDKYKPTQAWTQGETEANSCWFPTVDKPNYKSKFTINVTVPSKFTTLSNGTLTRSNLNADGTRTDTWQQTKPMSAYLVMLAIGEYAIVDAPPYSLSFLEATPEKDSLPIRYYVEPQYKSNAHKIFEHTPEMIDFFSKRLNYPFAWSKYSQVTARDYVSGAMENTSASLFGEFVQVDERGSIDQSNEGIVAHELFHQWFGDVVTCESWSHLTMNEGFASYGEYLWTEYKYGKAEAERLIYGDIKRYLRFAEEIDHPLINFYYKDKEDMFNAISYRKGARILHLMRYELGDSIFFAGLSNFLHQYEMQAVEADHLRLEMEKVSGRDLRQFWNQWYYSGGHPNLHLSYTSDSLISGSEKLVINYEQSSDSGVVYNFPIRFRIVGDRGEKSISGNINTKRGSIPVPLDNIASSFGKIIVYPDEDHVFIGKITDEQTPAQYLQLFAKTSSIMHKRLLMDTLLNLKDDAIVLACINLALHDSSKHIRLEAIDAVDFKQAKFLPFATSLDSIARYDSYTAAKAAAIRELGGLKDKKYTKLFTQQCDARSYAVANAALIALNGIDSLAAISIAERDRSSFCELTPSHVDVLTHSGIDNCMPYYEEAAAHMFGRSRIRVLGSLTYLAQLTKKPEVAAKIVDLLIFYATKDANDNVKANAMSSLKTLLKFYSDKPQLDSNQAKLKQQIQEAMPALK